MAFAGSCHCGRVTFSVEAEAPQEATSGTEAFAFGSMPDGTEMAAVNLRCVPAIDLDRLTLRPFDGAGI